VRLVCVWCAFGPCLVPVWSLFNPNNVTSRRGCLITLYWQRLRVQDVIPETG